MWIDGKYGFIYLKLGHFTGTIGWESTVPKGTPTGYKVSFEHVTLRARFQSQDEAKKALLALATSELDKAKKALEDLQESANQSTGLESEILGEIT